MWLTAEQKNTGRAFPSCYTYNLGSTTSNMESNFDFA